MHFAKQKDNMTKKLTFEHGKYLEIYVFKIQVTYQWSLQQKK